MNKLQHAAYVGLFRNAFGADVFSCTSGAFQAALGAQAYQFEDDDSHPYTSRFDLYVGNRSAAS